MTHSPEWHDSYKWVTWLICTCVVTHWYVWRDSCDLLYIESSPRIPTRNHFQFVRKPNIDTIIKTGRIQMCMYLCVCVCIYIYICTYFTLAHEYNFIYIYTDICVHMWLWVRIYVLIYLSSFLHVDIYMYTFVCAKTQIHAHCCLWKN